MYQQINKPMLLNQWMQIHWGWHIPFIGLNTGTPLDMLNIPLYLFIAVFIAESLRFVFILFRELLKSKPPTKE
jgi:hypothetical protein